MCNLGIDCKASAISIHAEMRTCLLEAGVNELNVLVFSLGLIYEHL